MTMLSKYCKYSDKRLITIVRLSDALFRGWRLLQNLMKDILSYIQLFCNKNGSSMYASQVPEDFLISAPIPLWQLNRIHRVGLLQFF